MNAAVIYSSMTGHSKKIANAIAQKLDISSYNAKLEHIELINMDLVFVVSGIYSGKIMPELEKTLSELDSSQIRSAAVIMSSVSQDYSRSGIVDFLTEKGIEIAGEHSCFGSFLVMKFGHPNKDEIAKAVEFAENIYNKYVLSDS